MNIIKPILRKVVQPLVVPVTGLPISGEDSEESWSSYWTKLTFDDIVNVPVADASSVSDWNTWFDLPTNGTPFTSVSVDGNVVTLEGGSDITLKKEIFVNSSCANSLIKFEDTGCVIDMEGSFDLDNLLLYSPFYTIGNACYSLTDVVFTDSLTRFSDCAFAECFNLLSITIPDSVTSIGISAFQGTSLPSVTIPNSVTFIGDYAFFMCANLAIVNMYPTTAPTVGADTFNNNAATLHIQAGATGYDVAPWTNTAKFTSIVQDL